MTRVVVVGGGIWGLTLAYRLEQLDPGAEVTLLERGECLGGVVGTVERDGFRVELGPNGMLDANPAAIALCQELGLGERLVPASDAARKNRFLFLGGKLRKLPGGLWSFLTSDMLSGRA
jgi:oxygen-dependent protoporphyrinogen oxidase